MSSYIVPIGWPHLALTVVSADGGPALALAPREPGNSNQQFDVLPFSTAAETTTRPDAALIDREALLLSAGTKAGMPVIPASYIGEGHILDFIIAFMKGDKRSRYYTILDVAGGMLRHAPLSQSISSAALLFYGIPIDPDQLGRYLDQLKQSTHNKGFAAFFKRIVGDKAAMQQLVAAATDYSALAREITALGFAVSAQDLQNYLGPWVFFASVLLGLKDAGTINQAQYEEHIGTGSIGIDITGLGPDSDLVLAYGLLSATGWVTRLEGFSEFGLPMQVLMIPVATIMVDSLTNQHNFAFKQLGPMMFNGFTDTMQATADGLQDFGNSVSSIF